MRRCVFLVIALVLLACRPTARPPEPPAPTRATGFVAAGHDARIYYEAVGTGPTLLFLHGLTGNQAVWFQQVPYFARDYRVVTLAQRGFAPSTGGDPDDNVEARIADAIAVLEHVAARDVVVIGQAMGGWTALGLALRRPDLVAALVLSGTVAGIFDDEIERHYARVTARARELATRPPALGAHPALGRRFVAAHADLAYLYQVLTSFGAPNPARLAEAFGRARVDVGRLNALRIRVLFVVGDDDEIFPPDIVRRAAARVTGAEVVVIPGAGHSPYFERPQTWNAVVDAFLRQTHR